MQKSMLIVGSSTEIGGSGSGFSKSATVSPISNPSSPTTAQISPHTTVSTLVFSRPSNTIRSFILCFSIISYLLQRLMFIPALSSPLVTLPMAIRPTYGEYSREDISICGVPGLCSGEGITSRMTSSSAVMSVVGFLQSRDIQPCFALPYTVLKSSWSSVALSENIRSKTSSCTSSGRQLGLSTLFITTIGFFPISIAF